MYISSYGTCVHILYMHECDLYKHTAILTCIVFTYYMSMYRPLIIHPIHPSLLSLFLHLPILPSPLLFSPLDRDGSGPCIRVFWRVRATSSCYHMRRYCMYYSSVYTLHIMRYYNVMSHFNSLMWYSSLVHAQEQLC